MPDRQLDLKSALVEAFCEAHPSFAVSAVEVAVRRYLSMPFPWAVNTPDMDDLAPVVKIIHETPEYWGLSRD